MNPRNMKILFGERGESNPRLLGEKQEYYICAMQPRSPLPLKKKVFLVLEFEPNSPENSSVEPDECSKRNDAGHEQSEKSKK